MEAGCALLDGLQQASAGSMSLKSQPGVNMTSVDFISLQSLKEFLCHYPNVTEDGEASNTVGTSVMVDIAV